MPTTPPKGERKPAFTVKRGSAIVPVYRYASGRYCIAWRKVAGGKLIRETKSAEKQARARAEEIATMLADGRAQVLELTAGDRDSYRFARSIAEEFSTPLHSAMEEWAAARKLLAGGTLLEAVNFYLQRPTCSKVVPPSEQILEELLGLLQDRVSTKDLSSKYFHDLKRDLTPYVQAFPNLVGVTETQLRGYLRELRTRKNEPVGSRTRDNARDAIARLYHFARVQSYWPKEVDCEIEKVERLNAGAEVTTWTPAELTVLLDAVGHKWRPWMAISAFAGLRTSEIFRLEWSHIKWEQRKIAVPRRIAKKIRVSRLVPLSDTLAAWLSPWRDSVGPIYPGNIKTTEFRHWEELRRLERATGLNWRNNANRHSYGSYRLAIIKDIAQLALEMGNSPAKIREYYNDPKDEKEADQYMAILPPESRADNIVSLPLEFHRSAGA